MVGTDEKPFNRSKALDSVKKRARLEQARNTPQKKKTVDSR